MKKLLSGLALLALTLGLSAYAGPSPSSGAACSMCSSKEEGKSMKCCDKHEAGGGCCKKGGTPAGGQEGHQH